MLDPLAPDALYTRCDPAALDFATTRDLDPFDGVIGQDRAVQAISFGTEIRSPGYNMYLLGEPGIGRHSTAYTLVGAHAAGEPVPDDIAYVNNFETAHQPRLLRLPAGRGGALKTDVQRLIADIQTAIPAAFESEDYQKRRQAIEQEYRQRHESTFGELGDRAQQQGIALMRTPMGFAFAPVKDGNVLPPDEFEKLPEEERKRIETAIKALQEELAELVKQVPGWEKEHRDAVRALNEETTAFAVGHPIAQTKSRFAELPQAIAFLEALQTDLVENFQHLVQQQDGEGGSGFTGMPDAEDRFRRYQVNLLVDNGGREGAPLIYEDNPTMGNLIGRVEHISAMGALITDFNLIKPGALHRANGGYLVLEAEKVLAQPFAWEALKRALKSGRVTIESPGQMMSLISTVSLEPEPVPLSVKVLLCGSRMLYYLLSAYDQEFDDMFKVAADFDDAMPRGPEDMEFARLVASICEREELLPFGRDAVARMIEHAARLAGDSEKISIHIESIADLAREADHFARQAGAETAEPTHVQQAIDARTHRADRLRERMHENILKNVVMIDTEGAKAGQINGLAVLQLGGFAFGQPSRITARVRLGSGKVVDIEREVETGGKLHSKGVLILSGFIAARYAGDLPLSLQASLVFEQSYGGVDGDSASSAELYCLLSALSGLPIRQDRAVTGSVNQHGEVQAIGGVNEKIEGFFDICNERGLTGEQGVLIPHSNVKHLMLRHDVVEACRKGEFSVWPVRTIDEGIELLTGTPAGERGADGLFPEGSVNRLVEDRLTEFAHARLRYARSGRELPGPETGERT